MIELGPYTIDPWQIRETSLDLEHLAHSESVFTLANGHIGLRGNLDEGDPHGVPGTYRVGLYRPITGSAFPVYLTAQLEWRDHLSVVDTLVARATGPFERGF